MRQKKRKRVEFQKFARTKLEHPIYRLLFGLTDNILLKGEEDTVLQREFRIDFVLQKKIVSILLVGIFSYFKNLNILEFKSPRDLLDFEMYRKYIGQVFWWLHAKAVEVKEKKADDVYEDEVTLTIITVGSPNNVIKRVRNLPKINFEEKEEWHYQWWVGGVEVHLLVINKMPVEEHYYAWLTFSTGKKYDEYRQKLAQEIARDDKFQVYLDLIVQLEQEGEDKMAYDVMVRFLAEMPEEQRKNVFMQIPETALAQAISVLAQKEEDGMTYDVMVRFLAEMPEEQRKNVFMQIPERALAQAISVLAQKEEDKMKGKKVARDIVKQMLMNMSSEERQAIIREVSDEK